MARKRRKIRWAGDDRSFNYYQERTKKRDKIAKDEIIDGLDAQLWWVVEEEEMEGMDPYPDYQDVIYYQTVTISDTTTTSGPIATTSGTVGIATGGNTIIDWEEAWSVAETVENSPPLQAADIDLKEEPSDDDIANAIDALRKRDKILLQSSGSNAR